MGALSGILLQHPRRRPVGPNVIDSKNTNDGRLMQRQMALVGQDELATRYGGNTRRGARAARRFSGLA